MKTNYLAALFLITMMAISPSVFAKAFLCIPEIPGDVTDQDNRDCIEITSFSVDFSSDSTFEIGTTRGTPKPRVSPFIILKNHDSATVRLQSYALNLRQLPEVEIRVFKNCDTACKEPNLVYTLNKVYISRHNNSLGQSDDTPSEVVDLSFTKYTVCAKSDDPQGGRCNDGEFSWDFALNQVPQ